MKANKLILVCPVDEEEDTKPKPPEPTNPPK